MKPTYLFATVLMLLNPIFASAGDGHRSLHSPRNSIPAQSTIRWRPFPNTEPHCTDHELCLPFLEVKNLYETARTPHNSEVTGWFSGRCYFPESGDLALGILLIGWNENDASGCRRLKFMTLKDDSYNNEERFDHLQPEDLTEVERIFAKDRDSVQPVSLLNGAMFQPHYAASSVDLYVRISQGQLVLKMNTYLGVSRYCHIIRRVN